MPFRLESKFALGFAPALSRNVSPCLHANPSLHEASGIEYRVAHTGDTPEIGRLLAEAFTKHDPPAIAVGLTPDEFEAFVTLWLPGSAEETVVSMLSWRVTRVVDKNVK